MPRPNPPPRLALTRTRVRHRASLQFGWAIDFNNNANAPAYWVVWDDRTGANWFSVDALELL